MTPSKQQKYTRNDTGERRHGFVAQDLEAACTDPFFSDIVGENPATDQEGEEIPGVAIKTVGYDRLTAILWTTVRDLRNRVQALENSQP